MQTIRSIIFTIFMWSYSAVMGVVALPFGLVSRRAALFTVKLWTHILFWALRVLCGITYEVRGRENVPKGAALYASKHQAMWETVSYFQILNDPAFVLKKELMALPVYGWYSAMLGMISIDRDGKAKALRALLKMAHERIEEGREVVIYPEGTRMPPGTKGEYQPGVAALYKALNVPCVPMGLNSGLYWRRGKSNRGGKIIVEFGNPISPGLDRKQFMEKLENEIESISNRLVEEGKRDLGDLSDLPSSEENRTASAPLAGNNPHTSPS